MSLADGPDVAAAPAACGSSRSFAAPDRFGAAELASIAAAVAVGTSLLGLHLGDKGLWFDEALSVARSGASFSHLWSEITSTQANMGLYYLLLHIWLPVAGTTEAGVRGLSMLAAALTLPAAWLLARRLSGPQAGVATVALLALNSYFIRYGQEARGYSLLVLLSVVSTLTLVRALDRPASRTRWMAYVCAGSLVVYSHLFGLFAILAHVVAVVAARSLRRPVTVAWLAMAALTSPLALFVVTSDVGQVDWIPSPRPADVLEALTLLSGDGGWWLLGVYAAAVLAPLALRRRTVDSMPPWPTPPAGLHVGTLLWAWLLLPVVVAFAVSMAKPIFQPRYLIVALPALVMLAGRGTAALGRVGVGTAMLAVLLTLSALGVRSWYAAPEWQFWRAAAAHVMSRADRDDAVGFFVYSARVPFEYYARRAIPRRGDVTLVDLTDDAFVAGNRQPEPSLATLDELTRTRGGVWLVRLQDRTVPGHPLGRREQHAVIDRALRRTLQLTSSVDFPGGIRVDHYRRPTGR